jgi:hypothetical protein
VVEFTERAVDALRRSAHAAARFDADARIRLTREGSVVRAAFVHQAEAGDVVVALGDGPQILVAADIRGTIDAGDHDALIVRP